MISALHRFKSHRDADQRRSEAGDTLVEILIAVLVFAIVGGALVVGFLTMIWGSTDYRKTANIDAVLKTAAAEASSLAQQDYEAAFSCLGWNYPNTPPNPSVPTGYTAALTVSWWQTGTVPQAAAFPDTTSPCPDPATAAADVPTLVLDVTVTQTNNGTKDSQVLMVNNPSVASDSESAVTATQLLFEQPPSGVEAGQPFSTSVVVAGTGGAPVQADLSDMSLSVAGPGINGSEQLPCSGSEAGGVVTFNGCVLTQYGSYIATANDTQASGTVLTTSVSFSVSGGPAASMVFYDQPAAGSWNGTGGSPLDPQPELQLYDAYGNPATSDQSDPALTVTQNGDSLNCTQTGETGGLIMFNMCAIDPEGTYTITATDIDGAATLTATSEPIAIAAGKPSQLGFVVQPTGGVTGSSFPTSFELAVEDPGGNVVPAAPATNISVTLCPYLSASSGSTLVMCPTSGQPIPNGATLSCPTNPTQTSSGEATFSGCSVNDLAAGYEILASATVSGSPASVVSTPFNVTGPPSVLTFTTQPVNGSSTVSSGTTLGSSGTSTNAPAVTVYDSSNDVVTTDDGVGATPAPALSVVLASNHSAAGASVQGCSPTESGGVITFTGCVVAGAENVSYELEASVEEASTTLTAYSSAFTLTYGPATQLVFTTEPGPTSSSACNSAPIPASCTPAGTQLGSANTTAPTVTVEDASGNPVADDQSSVTLVLASPTLGGTLAPGAQLTGCAATEKSGVFSFSGCQVDTPGDYLISAYDGELTGTSTEIAIAPGAPSKVAFLTPTSGSNLTEDFYYHKFGGTVTDSYEALSSQPVVAIEDKFGNVEIGDTDTVKLAGTGLDCTSVTAVAVNGVASFANDNCYVSGLTAGGTSTLTASDNTTTLTASMATVTDTLLSANPSLSTVTAPGNGYIKEAFATQPAVTVSDTGDASTVLLSLTSEHGAPAAQILGCSETETGSAFKFNNCYTSAASTTTGTEAYELTATDGTLMASSTGTFTTKAQLVTGLTLAVGPGNITAGGAFSPQLKVTTSGSGSTTGDSSELTLSISGSGTLSGCTATEANGVFTFPVGATPCTVTSAGVYTLTASDGAVQLSNPSSSFTVSPSTPYQLNFAALPATYTAGEAFSPPAAVAIEDKYENVVPSATTTVGLSQSAGTGLNCGGDTVTVGVATFSGCYISTATTGATDALKATGTGLTDATIISPNFAVGAQGTGGNKLVFTTPPAGATAGEAFATQPVVKVENAAGTVVTGDNSTVTLSLVSSSATLSCSGQSEAAGVVTFSNCYISTPGTYTITAADGTVVSPATSNPTLTVGADG